MSITRESKYFDNTKISTYKECPRKYLIRHVLGWTIEGNSKAPALVFGSCWHAGMDAMWGAGHNASHSDMVELARNAFKQEWEDNGYEWNLTMEQQDELGARTPGTAHEMYYSYATQRERMLTEAIILGIEQPIAMPFPGMSDTWYVGKLDKVVDFNGQHVLEHKTTTLYRIKGNFDADYVESWAAASQVKGYQMCASTYYPKLQDVWVDMALVHKKVHDAFKFSAVSHSWDLLKEWITDTGRWITEIQKEVKEYQEVGSLEKGTFRRNEDQCYGKYSKCPFLNICSTCSDPTKLKEVPSGYVEERWEPFDTLGLDKLIKQP